jgi:hypothetical protein
VIICRKIEDGFEVVEGLVREKERTRWSVAFRKWVKENGKEGEEYVLVRLVNGPIRLARQLSVVVEEVEEKKPKKK